MATYKDIKGFGIQYLDSDPTTSNRGQVWYNSTTKALKGTTAGVGAWASGGALNTARAALGSCGTQTAALAYGGNNLPGMATETEKYNGTSWTEVNNLSSGRLAGGSFGTQTSAIYAAGSSPNEITLNTSVESYDGTNWTEVTEMNTGRYNNGSLGASGTSG